MRKEVIQIRCSDTEKERWTEAAKTMGLELSPWIRLVLDRALRPSNTPATTMRFDLDQ